MSELSDNLRLLREIEKEIRESLIVIHPKDTLIDAVWTAERDMLGTQSTLTCTLKINGKERKHSFPVSVVSKEDYKESLTKGVEQLTVSINEIIAGSLMDSDVFDQITCSNRFDSQGNDRK